jgi:hypothetical protein
MLVELTVNAKQSHLARHVLADRNLGVQPPRAAAILGDDSEHQARVLGARMRCRPHGVVLVSLVGHDDQVQHHPSGEAAHLLAHPHQLGPDRARRRVDQLYSHRAPAR